MVNFHRPTIVHFKEAIMFAIRRRSTKQIIESGFSNREAGKPIRDEFNDLHYTKGKKHQPEIKEYYIVRTKNHYRGKSV